MSGQYFKVKIGVLQAKGRNTSRWSPQPVQGCGVGMGGIRNKQRETG